MGGRIEYVAQVDTTDVDRMNVDFTVIIVWAGDEPTNLDTGGDRPHQTLLGLSYQVQLSGARLPSLSCSKAHVILCCTIPSLHT